MEVKHITMENFEEEVLKCSKTVLLDFWADWCGPCKMMGPIMDMIAKEREDVNVCKLNVDENPQLAAQFGIMSIPTLMVFKAGQAVNKSIGAISKAQVLELIDKQ